MTMKKKTISLLWLVWAMVTVLTALMTAGVVAQGAGKPTLDEKSIMAAVGDTEYLYVRHAKPDADYIFSSDDEETAVVHGEGIYASVIGKDYGSCRVHVKEKYKGKTIKIGSCKVTVKKTEIKQRPREDMMFGIGKNSDPQYTLLNRWFLEDINRDASYHFISEDADIAEIDEGGMIMETKKAGKASIEVRETFKKKTRSLGLVVLYIAEPEINQAYDGKEFKLGETLLLRDLVKYPMDVNLMYIYDLEGTEHKECLLKENQGVCFQQKGTFVISVGTSETPDKVGKIKVIVN